MSRLLTVFEDQTVHAPAGWSWRLPFQIKRDGSRFVASSFDVSQYANSGKAYYVSTTGNDENDGLTLGTALRRINTAIAKADVDVVYVAAGSYHKEYQWSQTPTRNVSVIALSPGEVYSTTHQAGLSWALDETHTNTYKTTRSATRNVCDAGVVDANEDYQVLTLQASAADVDSNPGSWYTDGTLVYVRLSDDAEPSDSRVRVYTAISGGLIAANVHVYVEGINFEGGNLAVFDARNSGASQDMRVYFKDCSFKYGSGSSGVNGLAVNGATLVICQDCVSAQNGLDGFNYHVLNSTIPKVIEINCTGRDNGNGTNINNGSSIHDAGTIVRLNGEYGRNNGPNVVDVNASYSWNLGSYAHDSTGETTQNCDFMVEGTMWCDRCRASGSTRSYVTGVASTLYKRLCSGTGTDAGTIMSY